MAEVKKKVDIKKIQEMMKSFEGVPQKYSTSRETFNAPKTSWVEQQRWSIPEPFVIKVAPVGAFIMKEDNPNQIYTTQETVRDILGSLEAGACSFHTHVRDENGKHTLELKLYHEVNDPIKEKYGDKVLICGCPEGGSDLEESLRPVVEFRDIMEVAPVTVSAVNLSGEYSRVTDASIVQKSVDLIQECGVKPEIVMHNLGDISMVKRWLIDTKLLKRPSYFRLAVGNPGWGYIEDPYTMLECVSYMTRELRRIDPECAIMLDMAGRPGLYLIPLAIILGLMGARVGMEDSLYIYPHKDEMINDNIMLVKRTVAMVEALGRKVGTADDYRKFLRDGGGYKY
jgi:3-keto-5-aminohexanoate cleavage enzyme